jgi:hypothetical protein
MYSFLTEYFSSVVLVLHAIRCSVAQAVRTGGSDYLLAEVVDEGLPPVHVDHHDLLSSR